jgi:hypothetical protein
VAVKQICTPVIFSVEFYCGGVTEFVAIVRQYNGEKLYEIFLFQYLSLDRVFCTIYCNKLLFALLQDLSQPTHPQRVAFTFAFELRDNFNMNFCWQSGQSAKSNI